MARPRKPQVTVRQDPFRTKQYSPVLAKARAKSTASRRLEAIADKLFHALGAAGARVEGNAESAAAFFDAEPIEFEVVEKLRQVRVPPSDWDLRLGTTVGRRGYAVELEPTGILVVKLDGYPPGKREWVDTSKSPLEAQIPDIVEAMRTASIWFHERREEDRAAAQRREEKRQAYLAEREIEEREGERWRRFIAAARSHEDYTIARNFVLALRGRTADTSLVVDGRSLEAWLRWAEARADALDPLANGIEAFFASLSSGN
ncbi:hypothetical protein [Paradevosia shaoguanensis]|uniref:Uncharacterized protein n=1 Tax=Paradevosia shaoguanensis TaxID=1335043 RepID=A0AA41UIC0_9HYPH|nr:hypothetical protein [Paradevosia shaoguanensis]MCF1744708.1 hypothetical protein [Paradevosia shaoguanensis]MCI0129191.1 hypothetical protein [Paradevosia shaoguanensis]